MDDDALLFDASDALVTADIDLIMDDELPSDALGAAAGGADDALGTWQDDAARILFASMDPDAAGAADTALASAPKPRSASVSTMSTAGSSSGSDDDDDWRRPHSFSSGTARASSSYHHTSRNYHHPHAPHRAAASAFSAAIKFEPSQEPCSGEIPYSDLVFWLGDTVTGEVECSCAMCARGRRGSRSGGGLRGWRLSPYERISSKIPIVSIPRIEGWN